MVRTDCHLLLYYCSAAGPVHQVLLKRYHKSLPFIELLGFLGQFFRRLLNFKGSIHDSMEQVQTLAERCVFWQQDEVEAISRMDMAAAFESNVVSFDDRWQQYLVEPLCKELQFLQVELFVMW